MSSKIRDIKFTSIDYLSCPMCGFQQKYNLESKAEIVCERCGHVIRPMRFERE
jgi:transcription initiation factor TFIIIB Brf1 subunit/transcription initiation factor TFIIB